jgi:hypothetical protein
LYVSASVNTTLNIATLLDKWLNQAQMETRYSSVQYPNLQDFKQVHTCSEIQKSIAYAQKHHTNFCFLLDTNTFLVPHTLRSLVQLNITVVVPMLDALSESAGYNFYDAFTLTNNTFQHIQSPRYDYIL